MRDEEKERERVWGWADLMGVGGHVNRKMVGGPLFIHPEIPLLR